MHGKKTKNLRKIKIFMQDLVFEKIDFGLECNFNHIHMTFSFNIHIQNFYVTFLKYYDFLSYLQA